MKSRTIEGAVAIILTLFNLQVLANGLIPAAGNEGPEGGDPRISREFRFRGYLEREVRSRLRLFLNDSLAVSDRWLESRQISELVRSGILSDLRDSRWIFPGSGCYANGVRVPASTLPQRGADVCFDLNFLSQMNPSLSELIGIALHEHAHHFGIEDARNELITFTVNLYDFYKEESYSGIELNLPQVRRLEVRTLLRARDPRAFLRVGRVRDERRYSRPTERSVLFELQEEQNATLSFGLNLVFPNDYVALDFVLEDILIMRLPLRDGGEDGSNFGYIFDLEADFKSLRNLCRDARREESRWRSGLVQCFTGQWVDD